MWSVSDSGFELGLFEPFRKGQCECNWNSHISYRHFRDHRAVHQLYHRMNYTLRMNYDGDLIGVEVKQSMRLDDLQAFVHEGCRIDRDLVAHSPGGMFQRVFDRNPRETLGRPLPKRSAGGG